MMRLLKCLKVLFGLKSWNVWLNIKISVTKQRRNLHHCFSLSFTLTYTTSPKALNTPHVRLLPMTIYHQILVVMPVKRRKNETSKLTR